MQDIMGMIPGMDASKLANMEIDEKQLARTQAIIKSMTPKERRRPDILNASRRRRIARGSGTTIQEVNRLINQFEATRKMMRQFSGKGKRAAKEAACASRSAFDKDGLEYNEDYGKTVFYNKMR